ncbi:phosphoglycerate mutase family protein [Aspergillus glaucus CBS 516.65]|uniref:Phosphoglycerate mutase family protein n=1 Tax=Aspergillus glaucus CBS 516.65 TaxID=1160497 RepID=A0A1L9VF08_ASPGL|nr:hypothetical protein ASPGLDRAFT_130345 [Aspergillus glaucus CBS 516.65]OJJ82496.1 hypothetical protein ASPGLDRAFT_130345 [Aspergillus glaucus CBS 516.65]
MAFHFNLTTVPGYFLQDEPDTDPDAFNYVSSNFGLINRTYNTDTDLDIRNTTQWQRFEHHLNSLNQESHHKSPNATYRLLFLGRHGEGFHNVAEEEYGTKLWDCYYSLQTGDANITWFDAHLTTAGIKQAQIANGAWKKQIEHKVPFPESFYVSPLHRCLATAETSFKGLNATPVPFRPVVKELLRETIGIHTCDKRSSASHITTSYPDYIIEKGFANGTDPLWRPDARESNSMRDARLRDLLYDIFEHDANTVLSLTAHSGAITSILNVVGHREFALATGAMIPVVVRVEKVPGPKPGIEIEPPSGVPSCDE